LIHAPQAAVQVPPAESTAKVTGGSETHRGGTAVITGLLPPPGVTSTTKVNETGATQELKGVPTAVYVVVDGGFATTEGPVIGVKPAVGVQVQV
jgi:hypothetical protein